LLETGALERRLPSVKNRMLILSPFDNSVIQRERLKSLFQYDYQIECYVPAAKRQYGYFSLPLLYRDEFIGRMDCKADRKTSHLEIKSLYLEKPCADQDLLIAALIDAITQFCHFQKCDTVSLTKVQPKHLGQSLRSALKFSA
ncbi:MAG: winged helix DNA-binding domain-containing protein, partial [Gammaproteobacteria bacterium]|nr:winged helix DNA-binding domain-containing protein [Gammaproteobacteria bacterium]